MGFLLESKDGYSSGERYEKDLTFIKINNESTSLKDVVLKDENGILLLWQTTSNTKGYKELELGTHKYRFTVKTIYSEQLRKELNIIISMLKKI